MGTEDKNWSSDSDLEETVNDDLRSACNWPEKRYTVLKERDLRKLQEEDITEISTVLYIATASATILLRYYDWNVVRVQEAWFANEEKVRKDVGLLLENQLATIQSIESTIKCPICFHEFPRDGVCATFCGHLFCKLCWTQYVSKNISEGPGCLKMQCPEPSCAAAVGQDMINDLVSDEDKEKYSRYLVRSYVDDQRNIKWCPGPGCEYAVGFIGDNLGYCFFGDSSIYDVVCNNGHSFCWNCLGEAHRPVDCDTAGKWTMQNSNEPENLTWIFANSKPCPKCKRPIQKNQGGMHMTCRCGFEFCWLCLSDWSAHWESAGDYYSCNVYEKARAEGVYDEEEKIKKEAKDYLDKYAFYYERFVENQKSRLKAAESLQKFKSRDLAMLRYSYYKTDVELDFITDAWQQIMECRRVLKWSYVYAYYLPTSEHVRKPLLDYHQGEAELCLERLHECAEQEIQKYILYPQEDDAAGDFIHFLRKLRDLTSITRTYFENLVRSLENGLSEVGSR